MVHEWRGVAMGGPAPPMGAGPMSQCPDGQRGWLLCVAKVSRDSPATRAASITLITAW